MCRDIFKDRISSGGVVGVHEIKRHLGEWAMISGIQYVADYKV